MPADHTSRHQGAWRRRLRAPAFALALTAPSPAWAAPDATEIAAVAVAIVAALALLGAILLARRLAAERTAVAEQRRAAADLEALIGTGPYAFYAWRFDGSEAASVNFSRLVGIEPTDVEGFGALGEAFEATDWNALSTAVQDLRESGGEFVLDLAVAGGDRRIEATGLRIVDSRGRATADAVWFRDSTQATSDSHRLAREIDRLSAERAMLRAVLDSASVPIWWRGPDLRIAGGNRAYVDAVDAASLDQAVADNREIAAGPVAGGGKALAARAAADGTARDETLHVVIGGDRRLVRITETALAETGTVAGHLIDRTELAETRTQLSRHDRAHANVLEHLGSAIAIFGRDRRIHFYNTAYVRLWQLDEGWLRSEPDYGEILEALRESRRLPEYADFPAFKQQQLDRFTEQVEAHHELLHLPDGATLRSVTTPHPLGGLLMTFEDVTDRLALERSYNTLSEVQRETLDKLYEGVAVFGSDLRLKLTNPAFARIWAAPPALLESEPHVAEMADHIRTFFQDDAEWGSLKARIVDLVTERGARSGRLERSDGTVVDWAKVPLPDGATMLSFVDVTDSIRVERALRERAEALETTDQLKSEFIANVSYELRNPLNAVIGFAELLHGGYAGALNEKQADYTESILNSSRQLLSLINDILDLAMIEAGRITLQRGPVPIGPLLNGTVDLCADWAQDEKVAVDVECPADIGTVDADERRLRQALYNLVSNAIKFTPAGGRVTLSARRRNGDLELAVTDTGIGIPEGDRERVMEKFESIRDGRTRETGAGLGLALVKSFVELHGGHVAIQSERDKGTTVSCVLPIEPPADGREAASETTDDAAA